MIIGGWHYMLSSFHLPGTLLLSAYDDSGIMPLLSGSERFYFAGWNGDYGSPGGEGAVGPAGSAAQEKELYPH